VFLAFPIGRRMPSMELVNHKCGYKEVECQLLGYSNSCGSPEFISVGNRTGQGGRAMSLSTPPEGNGRWLANPFPRPACQTGLPPNGVPLSVAWRLPAL